MNSQWNLVQHLQSPQYPFLPITYHFIQWHLTCHCVAVCFSVLQCVAVCCSVLQCVAVCCSEMTSHILTSRVSNMNISHIWTHNKIEFYFCRLHSIHSFLSHTNESSLTCHVLYVNNSFHSRTSVGCASRINKVLVNKAWVMSIRHTSCDSRVSVGCCVTNQEDTCHVNKAYVTW